MSTLTKVLIVLLTVFSLFLCGIVVTYVATAENFRKTASDNQNSLRSARAKQEDAQKGEEEAKKALADREKELTATITALNAQKAELAKELEDAKRQTAELVQRVANMDDKVTLANDTLKQQTTLFQDTQKKVQTLEAERIDREKELTETSQSLVEKVATIAQLRDTVRQLTQENQELGNRLNQYLIKLGREATAPPTTVVAGSAAARPAQSILPISSQTKGIGLAGQVTAADLRSHLVEISIGTAAGVRKEMTFHIVRGDQFVADILIMEVWPDRAVGVLDVVKTGMQPQAGDKATTNI